MADRLTCTLCDKQFIVSDEDPDATVDDAVQHIARMHARDPLAGEPNLIRLDREPHDSGLEPRD